MKKLAVLALGVFIAACGDSPTESAQLSPAPLSLDEIEADECTQCVSGHTNFTVEDGLQTLSFNAAIGDGGVVTGTFQIKSRGQNTKVHGSLDCLTIEGNRAFLNGVVERINDDSPFIAFLPPGSRVYFGVEDNGEGQDAVDTWTDIFPIGGFAGCFDLGLAFHIPNEGGNIQVKP